MNNELYLKQSEADFNALRKASEEVAEQVNLITVTDPHTLSIAHQQLSLLKAKISAVEELRVKLKQPSLEEGRAIDTLAKRLSAPMTEAFEAGKKKILAYENSEKERVEALKQKISQYANKACDEMSQCLTVEALEIKYARYVKTFPADSEWQDLLPEAKEMRLLLRNFASQKKIALLNPEQADETVEEEIEKAIDINVSSVEIEKPKGLRRTRKAEVKNIREVPVEWVTFDEAKAKEWRKNNPGLVKDGDVIMGVRFYIEESLTIR